MGASRAPITAVAAVVGGVLLVAVLVTWAASIGPSGVLTGEGPEAQRLTPEETTSLEAPTGESPEEVRDRLAKRLAGDHPILRAIAFVLELVALLAILYVLFRLGRWAWETFDARRRPPPPPEEVEFDVLEGPRRLVEEITRDAAEQRRVLLEGTPRNAIVECWHRFEQQAAGAGLERHPWETSSEFTLRMFDLVAADSHAVAELAVLYREARFSTHSLDEAARDRAVADLDAIHAGLLAGLGEAGMKRWLRRAAGAAALLIGLDIALTLFDFAPDHLRLALLVALAVAVTGLLTDSLGEDAPVWRVEPIGTGGATATDPHLASYVRILESHLTARTPDAALRDRLAALCDERLARRHALTRDETEAEALLGPALLRDLVGPPRRLRREEIDGHLRRIEDL